MRHMCRETLYAAGCEWYMCNHWDSCYSKGSEGLPQPHQSRKKQFASCKGLQKTLRHAGRQAREHGGGIRFAELQATAELTLRSLCMSHGWHVHAASGTSEVREKLVLRNHCLRSRSAQSQKSANRARTEQAKGLRIWHLTRWGCEEGCRSLPN